MAPVFKSGSQIVNEFLLRLAPGENIDAATLNAIKALQSEDKLTRVRLIQALERIRLDQNREK